MRSLTAVVVSSSLLAGVPGAHAGGQSAESYLDTARQLAAHGHCDEALRLRPVIEHLDPELARTRFASDPAIAACLAGTAPPPAPTVVLDDGNPPAAQRPTEPAKPTSLLASQAASTPALVVPRGCHSRPYLEASVLDAPGAAFRRGFNRAGAGVLLRNCTSPVQGHLGATAYIGQIGQAGVGLEGEVSDRMSSLIRIGGHAAVETAAGGMLLSIDLRLHIDDLVWLQAGAYRWSRWDEANAFPPGVDIGFAAGLGVEGKPGAIIGGVELGLAAAYLVFGLIAFHG